MRRVLPAIAVLALCLNVSLPLEAATPERLWHDRMAAAVSAHQRGDLKGAAGYLESALPEAETFGPEDRRLAETFSALGAVYYEQGRGEAARDSLARAQKIFDLALAPEETRLGSNLNALGLAHARLAEDEAAIAAFKRAAAIFERAMGADHPSVARVLENHAGLLLQAARFEEARDLYPRVLAIQEKSLGTHHPELVPLLDSYALSLRMSGDEAGAAALDRRSAEILAKSAN